MKPVSTAALWLAICIAQCAVADGPGTPWTRIGPRTTVGPFIQPPELLARRDDARTRQWQTSLRIQPPATRFERFMQMLRRRRVEFTYAVN